MGEDHWEPVYEAYGQLEAEMVRGLLEAQGIMVFLSQEGAGHAFALTVGPMGLVQVLVPESQIDLALEIIQSYKKAVDSESTFPEAETDDDLPEES
jgi:hypothetical protein